MTLNSPQRLSPAEFAKRTLQKPCRFGRVLRHYLAQLQHPGIASIWIAYRVNGPFRKES
jgi:hypothetical protein